MSFVFCCCVTNDYKKLGNNGLLTIYHNSLPFCGLEVQYGMPDSVLRVSHGVGLNELSSGDSENLFLNSFLLAIFFF